MENTISCMEEVVAGWMANRYAVGAILACYTVIRSYFAFVHHRVLLIPPIILQQVLLASSLHNQGSRYFTSWIPTKRPRSKLATQTCVLPQCNGIIDCFSRELQYGQREKKLSATVFCFIQCCSSLWPKLTFIELEHLVIRILNIKEFAFKITKWSF